MGLVYVLDGIERDSCMYWVVLSGTRVCIGWYHERDSCMYWVVT